jgi:MFS family permease
MLLLGLFTSNYAILFFLIGFLIAAPLAAWVVNRFIPILFNSLWNIGYYIAPMIGTVVSEPGEWTEIQYFKAPVEDVCKLVIPYLTTNNKTEEVVISSEWMAMVSFFIGYIICNALQLYNMDMSQSASLNSPDAPDTKMKEQKRKGQAMMALISIIIFALIVLCYRLNQGCEKEVGVILTAIGFGTAGYYWYDLLSQVGQGRLSDIFGIANRLLAPSAIKNGPIACVPIPSP